MNTEPCLTSTAYTRSTVGPPTLELTLAEGSGIPGISALSEPRATAVKGVNDTAAITSATNV